MLPPTTGPLLISFFLSEILLLTFFIWLIPIQLSNHLPCHFSGEASFPVTMNKLNPLLFVLTALYLGFTALTPIVVSPSIFSCLLTVSIPLRM